MALYEIILHRPDRPETRFTDQPPRVGSTILIDYHSWTVERVEETEHPIAKTRYICVLSDESRPSGA